MALMHFEILPVSSTVKLDIGYNGEDALALRKDDIVLSDASYSSFHTVKVTKKHS